MREYANKRDSNEPKIIQYLRRCGCSVTQLNQSGVPDLLIGFLGHNILAEVKGKYGTLTEDQRLFFDGWNGQVHIVRSIHETKEILKNYMPIRVYTCETCGTFEKKESIKSEPLTLCPTCGSMVIQVFSAPHVVFKGNGWGGKDDTDKK